MAGQASALPMPTGDFAALWGLPSDAAPPWKKRFGHVSSWGFERSQLSFHMFISIDGTYVCISMYINTYIYIHVCVCV